MRILILGGIGAISLTMPITIVIVVILGIVATSYMQTIKAYPTGASSYIVASDNLGTLPGLTAAAALLIDYTLTVAVSVSSGVAAVTSIVPSLFDQRVLMAVVIVAVLMLGNLRGIRESGSIFMAPTYLYIVTVGAMILVGLFRQLRARQPRDLHRADRLADGSAGHAADDRHLGDPPHPARLQLGRGRPDRRRGGLRRRARLQAAGVAERAEDAHCGRSIIFGALFLGISYLASAIRRSCPTRTRCRPSCR